MPRVGDNTIHLEAIRPTQRLGISVGRSTSFRCKKVYPFPEMPLTYLKTCRPSTAFFPLINVTLSGGNSSPKPLTVIYEYFFAIPNLFLNFFILRGGKIYVYLNHETRATRTST